MRSKVRDHLDRSPDLFPPAAKVGDVEHVDERALERRHPNGPAGVGLGDAAAEVRLKSARRANADELAALGSSASDASTFMTGSDLLIDGGYTAI